MNQDLQARPTVVVIGGGYGGVNVAKALDEHVNVVLVEPKDAFVHNIGALRALVDPAFLPKIFMPYDRLLAHGRVVRDRAVEVSAQRVVLASGEAIAADYIVLATGSAYPFPAKSNAHDADDAIDNYRAAYDELEHANRVLLVGAGPVGHRACGRDHREDGPTSTSRSSTSATMCSATDSVPTCAPNCAGNSSMSASSSCSAKDSTSFRRRSRTSSRRSP